MKSKLSKSEMVRAYYLKHPAMKPADVARAASGEYNVEIPPGVVYSAINRAGFRAELARAAAASSVEAVATGMVTLDEAVSLLAEPLEATKRFVQEVGGVERARVMVDFFGNLSMS